MQCKLSLRQIEKYTARTWPDPECLGCKLKRLAQEQVKAAVLAARMANLAIAGDVEQFQATVEELRGLMDDVS